MKKFNPTPEQKAKAEARREHLKELAAKVAAMTEAEKAALIERIGTIVTCAGHPLSLKNTMLLSYQINNPSMVGGFQQWRAAGRQVRKGESALGIFAPRTTKEEAPAEAGKEEKSRMFFLFVNVFDVSQTDPISAE